MNAVVVVVVVVVKKTVDEEKERKNEGMVRNYLFYIIKNKLAI